MKSTITSKWYLSFLLAIIFLFVYEWIKKIMTAQSAIEFYLESVMLILVFIILYAIIFKHYSLSRLVKFWAVIIMLISFSFLCTSIFCYYSYTDYVLHTGFKGIIYWGLRFLASCVVFGVAGNGLEKLTKK
ncbi:MAG: hypothetical protein IPN61_01480 [Bacteroidetes bacterium]|nr:hypothetical protein [Bacteroidota bacterium]